jgi:hypothetical protein
MKCKTNHKEEMKNDLMRVYREIVGQYSCRTQTEAYELTVKHQAPRYYIDARWALQVISPMTRGDHSRLEKMSPLMQQMYYDLLDTVLRLKQTEKFWYSSLYELVRHAIQEPAPRFYIDTDRMGQIWREKTVKRVKVDTIRRAAARKTASMVEYETA